VADLGGDLALANCGMLLLKHAVCVATAWVLLRNTDLVKAPAPAWGERW